MQRFPPILLLVLCVCCSQKELPSFTQNPDWKTLSIPAEIQDSTGNAKAGYNYLIYGNYIGSGTPFELMKGRMLKKADTILARTGDNEQAFYWGNVFTEKHGQKVFAGNCLMCHAGELNGKVVIGLGGNGLDFRKDLRVGAVVLRAFVHQRFKVNSPERHAFEVYGNSLKTVPKYIRTNNIRVNPAFRLEEACTIFRNPVDLSSQSTANFKPIRYTLASDVPPLWNVKKKNALYYNGMGRGSMTKLLMQASLLGIPDTTTARKIHNNFDDVLAYIHSLEAPQYPKNINREKAEKGQAVFEEYCSKCHGSYGNAPTYPNKLIALHVVKTDPLYARYFKQYPHLANWYNASWFANSTPKSHLQPEDGYIAPPLDGIWASAPYLHNGSVPNLATLLNSPTRPVYWQKERGYDHQQVGFRYTVPKNKKNAYDTQKPGYGNMGHTFGDKLNEQDRSNLIEYLKTL